MSRGDPYRRLPSDASRLDWIELRQPALAITTFAREHGGSLGGWAVALPALVIARVVLGSMIGMSALAWGVAGFVALAVVALWPLSRELIRIDARGLVWRDRRAGAKAVFPLDVLRVTVEVVPTGATLVVGDGRARYLVARGDAADVEALAHAFQTAIERARRADVVRSPAP